MTMMAFRSLALALLVAIAASSVAAFSTQPTTQRPVTALSMKNDGGKKTAASFVAAAYLVGSLATVDVAMAAVDDPLDFGSSQVVSARSGGRAGGRSRAPSRAPSTSRSYSRTTVIQRPMYAAPPVVVSPFGMGYGYNPLGGFGLGYGLGAMGSAGDSIRDARQEGEIQRSQIELDQAKAREAQLEERIRALEQSAAN